MFDECINQIHTKVVEYSRICIEISEKLSSNNNVFERHSKDLVIKETSLQEIENLCTDFKIKIEKVNNELQKISNDIDVEKNSILEQETSKNSFNLTLCQLQEEMEILSNDLGKKSDNLQQIEMLLNNAKKKEEINNEKIVDLRSSVNKVENCINQLAQDVAFTKRTLEEKSYTKLNTHKETLDYERSSIPLKQSLVEIADKCSKTKIILEQIQKEEQNITNELNQLTKNMQDCKSMNALNESQQQNEVMVEARLKGESQAISYRLSEAEKCSFQVENEYKNAKEELDRLITNEIELKSTFVQKMGEAQHLYANEDTQIRQLTLDINELKVKIDMIKSKQSANKQLEEHIKKNEEEMSQISSQNRIEPEEEDSTTRQTIIPTILKLKKNKSRFLEID